MTDGRTDRQTDTGHNIYLASIALRGIMDLMTPTTPISGVLCHSVGWNLLWSTYLSHLKSLFLPLQR